MRKCEIWLPSSLYPGLSWEGRAGEGLITLRDGREGGLQGEEHEIRMKGWAK